MIRARAILWLIGLIAIVTAGSLSAASAHDSYGAHVHAHHAQHSEAANHPTAAPAGNSTAERAAANAVAVSSAAIPPVDAGCDSYGGCAAGHCATCVAVIAPTVSAVWLPPRLTGFGWHRPPAIAAAVHSALKRPPRS